MYDKFIKTIHTDRLGDMEVATAFVEFDSTMLDELIPVGASAFGQVATGDVDENDEPITRQKTVKEFVFPHLLVDRGNGRHTMMLGAMEAPVMRKMPVGRDDLVDWDGYLTPYGYPSSTWMTLEEYREAYPEMDSI